jgi:hypothetical protein
MVFHRRCAHPIQELPMRLAAHGTVYQPEAGSPRASAFFATCTATPGGRWVVGLRVAPRKSDTYPQQVALTWSDDQGASWSPLATPFTAPAWQGQPGDFRALCPQACGADHLVASLYWVDASEPRRPFFNEQTEGLLPSRIMLSESHDAGASWTTPRWVDTGPFTLPTPITGPPLRLADGRWAVQFEVQKAYDSAEPWHHQAVLLYSADGGRTWPAHSIVAADPAGRIFYWDQRPRVLPGGDLLDLFWTFDRQTAAYLPIHARRSAPDGHTWGPLWSTGVPGQPAPIAWFPDGRLVMVYVDREGPPAIRARTSRDGGRTWPADTLLTLADSARPQARDKQTMQDAWAEMAKFSLGLPDTALLPGGDVLVTWYAGPQTDHTAIHWARLSP